MSKSPRSHLVRRAALTRLAFRSLLTTGAGLLGLMPSVQATDKLFTQTTGTFETDGNWNPTGIPGSSDNAIVENGGTVTISTDRTLIDIRAGDNVDLTLGAGAATGNGTWNQTAGTITINGWFRLAADTASVTGTYNMSGGSIVFKSRFEIGETGTGVLNMTGGALNMTSGAFTSIGLNTGSRGTFNMSAGTFTNGAQDINVGDSGTGTLNINGSANFNTGTGSLYLARQAVSTGTINLGNYTTSNALGGTIQSTLGIVSAAGTKTINFDGGTLQANAASTGFVTTPANVLLGGLTFNNQTFNDTLSGTLLHGGAGTDGGLTKLGTGTLTLSGANTFNGTTLINAGVLTLSNALALQNSTLALSNAAGSGTVAFSSTVTGNAFTVGALSGNGNLILANNAGAPAAIALSVGNNNTNATYAGVLSGAGSLIKTGTATQALTNTNTYTGVTSINAGALSGGTLTSIPNNAGSTVAAGAALTYYSANDINTIRANPPTNFAFAAGSYLGVDTSDATGGLTYSQTIVDTTAANNPGFAKTGNGTLTLTGNNTYTGGTAVYGGTLQAGGTAAFGAVTGNLSVFGGRADVNGQNLAQNALTLGGGTVRDSAGTGNLTLNAAGAAVNITANYPNPVTTATVAASLALPNGGGIAKPNGFGTPVFTGGLTLGGATTIALADSPNDPAAELSLTGTIGGAGSLTLNDFTNPAGVTLANNQDFGTLLLSGNNTYTGGTNIVSGRVVATNGNAFGTGTIVITQGTGNSSTGSAGGVLSLGNSLYTSTSSPLALGAIPAAGITIPNNINFGGQIAGNYGYGLYNDSGANTLSGTITLTNTSQIVNVASGPLTFSGAVGQSSGVTAGLTKTGIGTLAIAGTDAYTGPTNVNVGVYSILPGGSLTGSPVNVAAVASGLGGTFNLGGTLTNSAITVAANTVPGVFTESATGLIAGTSSLTTSGTTTLNNNANTYTGATTILVSALSVADLENGGVPSTVGASTSAPANLVIGGNGTLLYTGGAASTDRGFTVGSAAATGGATINTANDLTFGGQILAANNASFTKLGTGTLTFTNSTGTNTFTAGNSGNTLGFSVNQGTVNIGGTAAAPVNSTNSFFGEVDAGTINSATSPTATLNFNGGTSNIGTYLTAGRVNGTNNAATFVNLNNNAVVSVGNLAVGFSGGLANYSSSPTVNFNNTSTFTDAGVFRVGESVNVSGVTTVNVNNAASLTLNGGEFSVGYQGPAVFNQNGGTVLQNGTTAVTLANNSTTSSGVYNLNGGTLSAPRVVKGAGTGTFNFNGGTLRATASDAPATAPFLTGVTANVGSGGAVIDTNGFTVTAASALVPASGSTGGLTKNGAGQLNLVAANTYTGSTTIANGTLNVNSGSTGPTTAGSINATGSVVVNAGGTLLLSGSSTVNTRVNDTAPVTLTNATVALAGVAEGGGGTGGLAATGAQGVGALTLAAGNTVSIIDLRGTSLLHFAASGGNAWTGTLSIYNYSGTAQTGGGAEQLLFGMDDSTASLTTAQLGQINFYSDNGTTFLGNAGFAGIGDGEIVPVPEPATWLAGALTAGLLGYTQRRRASAWLKLARAA